MAVIQTASENVARAIFSIGAAIYAAAKAAGRQSLSFEGAVGRSDKPIGGSDFVTTAPYTFDDLAVGQTDYGMRKFSIAHDQTQILPLLRQARALNPQLKIIATPWSPPAWMKTTGTLIGGRLISDPRVYRAYALYLLRFLEAYRDNGVTVNAITVQNEPQNRSPSGYPGTDMPSWQEAAVIEDLGPMLRSAHLDTQIFAYDHNWTEHPNDVASTPPDETADINDYPQQVLSTPAARWISGIALHCYFGDPSAGTTLHNAYPKLEIFMDECSGSQSSDPANTFSDTLKWHSRNLELGSTRNWSIGVINWNLALDPSGGPHVGGCGTCTGIITVGPGDTVTYNAEYYALGHMSRFVRPGAVRIASTSFGTTGWNGQVMDVAFRNPDGSTVLVAHNENDNAQAFAIQEGDQQLTYTLPGDSLATFVWTANLAGPHPMRQIPPAGWTAAANPPGPTDPCCTGDVAANAVDGRTVVTDASGTAQFTTVDLDGRPIRYLRMTLTAAAPNNWWSVADVRAYSTSHNE